MTYNGRHRIRLDAMGAEEKKFLAFDALGRLAKALKFESKNTCMQN